MFYSCVRGPWLVGAWVAKMKNAAGVPATDDVAIKVPKAWERVLEIEAFIYHFRFPLFVIVFLGGLGLAMLLRPGQPEAGHQPSGRITLP
jgi:hypothetical protein